MTILQPKEKKKYIRDDDEAYRQLRTNIEFSSISSEIKVLVVSSADSAEGKTTTVVNLAKVMAASKKRVLVIDADLRVPDIHKVYNLSKRVGLTNALLEYGTEDFDLLKYIHLVKVPNGINSLSVMTAGPSVPNPLEVLSSKRFVELMHYLREQFDFIVLDSAPILPVSDAISIGQVTDGLLFCFASEQSHKERAKQALLQLERTGVKVIGCCLTLIRKKNSPYDYYYYHYSKGSKKPTSFGSKLKRKRRKTTPVQ